ncbi:MAG: putative zinc-binding protein [Candidatus Jordarchaeales archaeon]
MSWEAVIAKGVGVLPCVGDIPEGEVTRIAARIAADDLCKGKATVLSLPLILCGNKEETAFIESSPVIVVDGCERKCGQCAIKKLGYLADETLVVTDIAKSEKIEHLTPEMIDELSYKVAVRIAEKINKILRKIAEDRKIRPMEL